jgi:glycosyltransferase involved in cell wall biosynthesis
VTRARVLHILPGMMIGGTENILLRLIRASPEVEHSVLVLAWPDVMSEAFELEGVQVRHLNIKTPAAAPLHLHRLLKCARESTPSVISGWLYHGNLAAAFAGKMLKRPYCLNIRHSLDQHFREKRTTRFSIRIGARASHDAAALVFNSRKSADQHRSIGYHSKYTCVIPNGVDTNYFTPGGIEADQAPREFKVAFIGRFNSAKNHRGYFETLGLLKTRGLTVKTIFAGTGMTRDNPAIQQYLSDFLIDAADVELLGEVSDVRSVYRRADMLILASVTEALPNVVLEAMACALPCLVTDVGDCAATVADTGWVVPPGDADALAEQLFKIVSSDRAQVAAKGNLARERAVQFYSLETMSSAFVQVWQQVADIRSFHRPRSRKRTNGMIAL